MLNLAALFLILYSLALSLAPLVRARSYSAIPNWSPWICFTAWLVVFNLAHRASARRLPARDPLLLPVAGLLTGWGLLTIDRLFPAFGLRQTLWMTLAVVVFIFGLTISSDFRFLRRYKYLWLTGGLVLTGLTFFLGVNPLGYGPEMWLGCCGIYLQPSEPLKLLLIIYLAAYLADHFITPSNGIQRFSSKTLLPLLAPTLVMTGLALILLVIQRDLGTASIFLFLYAVIVYVASGRKRVALAALLLLILASVAGYYIFDVVRLRFDAWLNPWVDPSGRSYQIVQSLLAIANGGLIGRGAGLGSPGLVPVPHSDFIFAAVVEETGLLGAIGVLIAIALMVYAGLRCALRAPQAFQRYLAVGLTAYIAGQSILIIAGNLRLLPLTGVTLPFVSYGGSSLLVSFISLLFLVVISNVQPIGRKSPLITRPVVQLSALLLIGLGAAGLTAGWWTTVRANGLLGRTDNPRRAINDRFVQRGAILDRENRPINLTEGSPGEFVRQTIYPDLSPILGYTDPIFGQAGLEASLDGYLRGLKGNPLPIIWWNNLIYGQPPPGLDVRTSLDLDLQETADRLLSGQKGALVLLNAATGEILAMASHPTFNANRLAELGESLLQNPDSPLLNRTAQGLYPLGAASGSLLFARNTAQTALPSQTEYTIDNQIIQCAAAPDGMSWPATIAAGCPRPVAALGAALGSENLLTFFQDLGFYSPPLTYLPVNSNTIPADQTAEALAVDPGQRVSPLQMSLAIAALSNGGIRPAPQLATAVNEQERGWVILSPQEQPRRVLPRDTADAAANALSLGNSSSWQSLAVEPDGEHIVTWYLGGTLPDWAGTPLALAVLLEEDNPTLAQEIGHKLMQAAMGK